MIVSVEKWDDSLAIRIPKDILKSLNVYEGYEMEIVIENDSLLLKPKEKSKLESLVEKIDSSNLHSEVMTDVCVGNEVW